MCRPRSGRTKVLGFTYNPVTHQVLPDPIHHHSGRQRMLCTSQPLCQFEPTGGSWFNLRGTGRQNLNEATGNFLSGLSNFSPHKHSCIQRSLDGLNSHAQCQRLAIFVQPADRDPPAENSLKASLSPLATGDASGHVILRSGQAAETVASRLQMLIAEEVFPLVLGHWARGGKATAVDRQLGEHGVTQPQGPR